MYPIAALFESSGVGAALRRARAWRGLAVLNYHRIGEPGGPGFDRALWSATPQELDRQLDFLRRHFAIVAPGPGMAAEVERRGRALAITFDDGYRDNYELALPVLRAHGVRACFFIATGFVDRPRLAWWDEIAWIVRASERAELPAGEWLARPLALDGAGREGPVRAMLAAYKALPAERCEDFLDWLGEAAGTGRADPELGREQWLTWEMVRALRDAGMAVGGHTVDHPVLARCSPERQAAEVRGCLERLEAELGEPVRMFSYPDGARDSFDATTVACLREAGVELAFSFYGGHQRAIAEPLDVRRIGVSHEAPPALFRARATLPQLFAPVRGGAAGRAR